VSRSDRVHIVVLQEPVADPTGTERPGSDMRLDHAASPAIIHPDVRLAQRADLFVFGDLFDVAPAPDAEIRARRA
jgi:hypothetical protein